jgi:hypothetical protein
LLLASIQELVQILTQRRLRMPRIDEGDAQICEMTGIAGGKGRFARGGDTGDLDIADLD